MRCSERSVALRACSSTHDSGRGILPSPHTHTPQAQPLGEPAMPSDSYRSAEPWVTQARDQLTFARSFAYEISILNPIQPLVERYRRYGRESTPLRHHAIGSALSGLTEELDVATLWTFDLYCVRTKCLDSRGAVNSAPYAKRSIGPKVLAAVTPTK